MPREKKKIELQVTIHDTPAALRFGGDRYYVTFAGTDYDKGKAAALMALNKTRLKVTIEVDETQNEDNAERKETGSRPWIQKRRASADE
jgi:hypothetical protein